jgi:TRAP-type transport system periplasmic protein
MKRFWSLAAGLAGLAATGVAAQERTLTLSSGFPEAAVPPIAYQAVADWLAQNSTLGATVHSMSLLSLAETSPGIRDGIADAGYVLTPYYPAEYSETNLAADMTLLVQQGTDAPGLVMTGAVTEYVLLHCPDCREEYKVQNQLFLSGGASTEYSLVCNQPIPSPEALQGLSVRSGASVFGRWVENFGGTKVSIPGSEMYEALSQGVVQCTMVGLPDVINFQLVDVVSHIVKNAPGGVFAGTASMNINLDTWRGLTEEQRAAMLEAASLMTATTAVEYYRQGVAAEEGAKAAGIEVVQAPEAFSQATQAFMETDMKTIEEQFSSLYGVENTAEKMETIRGLVAKWKEKVGAIDPTDVEAFRELLVEEIYSKVDPATYGME